MFEFHGLGENCPKHRHGFSLVEQSDVAARIGGAGFVDTLGSAGGGEDHRMCLRCNSSREKGLIIVDEPFLFDGGGFYGPLKRRCYAPRKDCLTSDNNFLGRPKNGPTGMGVEGGDGFDVSHGRCFQFEFRFRLYPRSPRARSPSAEYLGSPC